MAAYLFFATEPFFATGRKKGFTSGNRTQTRCVCGWRVERGNGGCVQCMKMDIDGEDAYEGGAVGDDS